MTSEVTIEMLAESVYQDMMANIVRQVSLSNLSRYRAINEFVEGGYQNVVTNTQMNSNKDIFGQNKTKLKSSETSRYFDCGNCGRQIAGGRFASHMNKCLERDRS
ncbi:putative SAGA-associated factor [Clavispora lusitaniae]|uniref:SAGA-associated factor 11 n=1 Tax=Clavispora lusitaniae TaxID=36911 RepID=A0AA91PX35_CLALS|nr:putative SAGA-associated factor [Clavispora lusitaniae]